MLAIITTLIVAILADKGNCCVCRNCSEAPIYDLSERKYTGLNQALSHIVIFADEESKNTHPGIQIKQRQDSEFGSDYEFVFGDDCKRVQAWAFNAEWDIEIFNKSKDLYSLPNGKKYGRCYPDPNPKDDVMSDWSFGVYLSQNTKVYGDCGKSTQVSWTAIKGWFSTKRVPVCFDDWSVVDEIGACKKDRIHTMKIPKKKVFVPKNCKFGSFGTFETTDNPGHRNVLFDWTGVTLRDMKELQMTPIMGNLALKCGKKYKGKCSVTAGQKLYYSDCAQWYKSSGHYYLISGDEENLKIRSDNTLWTDYCNWKLQKLEEVQTTENCTGSKSHNPNCIKCSELPDDYIPYSKQKELELGDFLSRGKRHLPQNSSCGPCKEPPVCPTYSEKNCDDECKKYAGSPNGRVVLGLSCALTGSLILIFLIFYCLHRKNKVVFPCIRK